MITVMAAVCKNYRFNIPSSRPTVTDAAVLPDL